VRAVRSCYISAMGNNQNSDDFQLTPPPAPVLGSSHADGRTPMMRQYESVKRRYPDAILFFRMGDFYEMFGRDAEVASKVLEIALTTRDKRSPKPMPMCGIPHHALDNYIGKLIKAGYKIVICDQVEDPRLARGLVRREVTRVITPGTLLEENLLESRENNFLCAIADMDDTLAAAFVDVSTGDFRITCHTGPKRRHELLDDIDLYHPSEIIYPEGLALGIDESQRRGILTHAQNDWWFTPDYGADVLKRHFGTATLEPFELDNQVMVAAAGAALQYLKEVQQADLQQITGLSVSRAVDSMIIDDVTRRNLELTESWMTGDKKDSLLGLLDRTFTSMGARLLRQWLLRPLLDLAEIDARLDAVQELLRDTVARRETADLLKPVADVERLLTRTLMGTANARDLVALERSLAVVPKLRVSLEAAKCERLKTIHGDLDPLEDVCRMIAETLVEEPPLQLREGGLIADGADAELDELRRIVKDNRSYIAEIEHRERGRTGIPNLKVRYNKVFGYYIEVSRSNLDLVPDDYFRKQTLVNAERFITPELKEYESKVLNAQDRIVAREYELFCELRDKVAAHGGRVQRTARALAQLDVLLCFAENAAAYRYNRPVVDDGEEIRIGAGRHPVVESLRIEERFLPNDAYLNNGEHRLLIITGPNMGGKSTYLRQVALICLMAQMGSFVPAKEAVVGLVDRIFTRIGASDYLARGQSTFMVEMTETANILRNATPRSLIILDEIGRGTSTFDGLSIAWAVTEYIHNHPRLGAKTLFATHYHELTDLALTLPGVKNFNVAAREHGDDIIFLRSVVPGPSDKSYGIQVGKLAGLPREVVERAKEILRNLESEEFDREGRPKLAKHRDNAARQPKKGLADDPALTSALAELKKIETENLTPLEALNLLDKIKKLISDKK
jgi:DNA mismatch repair protein MutS